MSEIILCTGGARSGKSTLAEKLAKEAGGDKVLYVATAAVCDAEMAERVKKHRAQRPSAWNTWEGFWNFAKLREEPAYAQCRAVLIDCLGFMLNNIMFHTISDWDVCETAEMQTVEQRMLEELSCLMAMAREDGKTLIAVTNEVGMGLVPAERSSRYYRDILGRANQTVAASADRVYFLVSGIPLEVKALAEKVREESL